MTLKARIAHAAFTLLNFAIIANGLSHTVTPRAGFPVTLIIECGLGGIYGGLFAIETES